MFLFQAFCSPCRAHAAQDLESIDVPELSSMEATIPGIDADDLSVQKAARGENMRNPRAPAEVRDEDLLFVNLKAGDTVTVKSMLKSRNVGFNTVLRTGQLGQVISVDSEGDAKIYFGGYGVHWIWCNDWHKLSTENSPKRGQDLFKAKPSFHQLYEIHGKLDTAVSGQTYRVALAEPSQGDLVFSEGSTNQGSRCVKVTDLSTSTSMGYRFMKSASTKSATQEEICELVQQKLDCELAVLRTVGREEETGSAHCLRLVDHFMENGVAYTVLDGMGSQTLLQTLEAYVSLTERDLAQMFMQMLQAIAHLNRCRVVHRDIQPGRFTCSPATDTTGPRLRLCDFSFAAHMPEDGSKLKQVCGTPPFMSPEMLCRTGYDSSTDVWSFGVIAYVLMLGHFPYQSTDRSAVGVRKSIADGTQLPSFQPARGLSRFVVGSAATTFLQRLLFRETFGRYTPEKALEDDWLSVAVALGSEGAEGLPSMLPSLQLAKRAGLFGVNRLAQQSKEESAGPKSRLNKVITNKQRKYHGTKRTITETSSEEDDSKSTATGSSVSFDTVYSDCAVPCARQISLSRSESNSP